MSQPVWENTEVFISEEINDWIQGTYAKYQINLWNFVHRWLIYFSHNEELWPVTHRKKSQYDFRKYDYDIKQKSNLFNLDSLYRRMPKKSYTKERKQEFEILMMHFWLHSVDGEHKDYWQEYREKALPSLNHD